jgi:hypothetical protein
MHFYKVEWSPNVSLSLNRFKQWMSIARSRFPQNQVLCAIVPYLGNGLHEWPIYYESIGGGEQQSLRDSLLSVALEEYHEAHGKCAFSLRLGVLYVVAGGSPRTTLTTEDSDFEVAHYVLMLAGRRKATVFSEMPPAPPPETEALIQNFSDDPHFPFQPGLVGVHSGAAADSVQRIISTMALEVSDGVTSESDGGTATAGPPAKMPDGWPEPHFFSQHGAGSQFVVFDSVEMQAIALSHGGVRLRLGTVSFDCVHRGGELLRYAVQGRGGIVWNKLPNTVVGCDKVGSMKKSVQRALQKAPGTIKKHFKVTANGVAIDIPCIYEPLPPEPRP